MHAIADTVPPPQRHCRAGPDRDVSDWDISDRGISHWGVSSWGISERDICEWGIARRSAAERCTTERGVTKRATDRDHRRTAATPAGGPAATAGIAIHRGSAADEADHRSTRSIPTAAPVPRPIVPPPPIAPPIVPPPTAPSPVLATPGKQAASEATQPAPSTGPPPTQSPSAQSLPTQSLSDAGAAPPASATSTPGPGALAATTTEAPKWTSATQSLPFSPTVGVAAFRRGGSALVVFDERRPIDLSGVRDDPVFGAATIQLLPAATVLRLPLPANRNPAISQASQSWRLAVIETAPPAQPIPMRAEDGQLGLPVDAPSEVVAIADPETGTTLLVGTQLAAGQGFPTARQMPDFSLLPTWQGVVIAPLSDRVELRVVNSGFMLTGRKPAWRCRPVPRRCRPRWTPPG
jgi:hypothetical protein